MKLALQWLRVALALYISLAVLYTTNFFLSPLIRAAFGYTSKGNPASASTIGLFNKLRFSWLSPRPQGSDLSEIARNLDLNSDANAGLPFAKHNKDIMYWDTGLTPDTSHKRDHTQVSMPASLFLNKAFAVSQEHLAFGDTSNLDVIPYYYRASKSHKKDDITIATLVTRNRFAVFKQLVERYRGPVSVTVHVSRAELAESSSGGKGVNFLDALHALYSSSPLMSALVDVHLILTPSRNDRQFNAWRNAARFFARTDYVMMLDVDFVPCTDFRTRLLHTPKTNPIHELLRKGRAALVIPAFEYIEDKDGTDARTFPTSKAELIKLYNESRIGMFHATWSPGHNSTDYERFLYHSQPGEVYKVSPAHYQHAYEPYVIFRRDGGERTIPWCDERFVGYGGNKAACLYEMYLSGVDFYVLSDDFLVHQSHAYDEQARKLERRYNRRIYADFREEVCLKYLMAFRDEGTLGEPIARNAIEECKKVKGAARVVSMLLKGY